MKTYYKILFILLISLSFFLNSSSQDVHFTQFYQSDLTLNPALTGAYVGDWRVMNIYRNQWSAISIPFVTNALGFDKNFYLFNDKISAGGVIDYDKSGPLAFTVTKLQLSAAYHKTIMKNNLSLGYQFGYTLKQFDKNAAIFPSQWSFTDGKYMTTLDQNENTLQSNLGYIDMNIGFTWSRRFGRIEPDFGFAIYHFNKPNESFVTTTDDLLSRQVTHAGATIQLTDKVFAKPNVLLMSQGKASDLVIGGRVGYRLPENKIHATAALAGFYFRDGIRGRNADAGSVVVEMMFKHLDVGVAYDINISNLNTVTDGRGAFEISVVYIGVSTLLEKIAIPCDIQ